MTRGFRALALTALVLLVAVLGGDWLLGRARLDDVTIEGFLDPPSVIADGKHSIVLTVRVSEKGQPRQHDTLQAWLEPGGGMLIPEWSYTDEQGEVRITYTPNPASTYDVSSEAVIHVIVTTIGKLVEVDKELAVQVPLELPK